LVRNLYWSIFVALCLAAPSVVQAHHPGGGHGGGGVIFVGGGSGRILLGPWLSYPIDVLDSPPEAMSGALTPGLVISVYKVRARAAVVLTAPIKATRVHIPAGTVLAEYTYRIGSKTQTVWCDDEERGFLRPWSACFADGGAETFTRMMMSFANEGSDLSGVGVLQLGAAVMIAPASYRSARPDELPVTQIGYRMCDGDGVATPYRFTSVILRGAHKWSGASSGCPFGEWPNTDDKATETVDGLKLHFTRTGAGVSFVATSTLAPGPLADFGSNGPIRAMGSPDPADLRKAEAHSAPPLVLTGLAKLETTGVVQAGAVIASAPVIHGITGVLRNEVTSEGLISDRSLPAGQYVFGVPSRSSMGAEEITWCAPRPNKSGKIVTICFPRRGAANLWLQTNESLMPTERVTLIGPEASDLSVERKLIPFPSAMTLIVSFSRWYVIGKGLHPTILAEVKVAIESGGIRYPVGVVSILPAKDGGYRFPVQNGLVTLAPLHKAAVDAKPQAGLANRNQAAPDFENIDLDRAEMSVVAPTEINNLVVLGGFEATTAPGSAPPTLPTTALQAQPPATTR